MRFRHSALLLSFPLAVLLCRPAPAQVTYHHTATQLHDGRILIVGGTTGANPVASVFIHRLDGDFTAATPLNVARASHTATLLPDGRVLVAGGVNAAGTILNTAEVYDPVAGNWTLTAGNMAKPRTEHTANLLPNGKVLVCGGREAAAVMTATCDLFDPANLLTPFSATGSMGQARFAHSATLLYNSKVFVAGGSTSTVAGFANSTELYDPQTGSWAPGPSLIQKRSYHTATPLGDRSVLIAGGFNGKNEKENLGYLQTGEIYNPASDSITPAQPMQERRMFHSSVLLPNGEVSVYGGFGNITTSYATPVMTFQSGSSISVTGVTLGTGATGSIWNQSVLQLVFDANLSVKTNGIIADGDVFFSKPRASLSDGEIRFSDSTDPMQGTKASLNGRTIRGGQLLRIPLTITAPSGSLATNPVDTPSNSALLTAGALTINPSPLAASKSGRITSGSLSGIIDVGFPSYYLDARRGLSRILGGSATIIYGGGNITQAPSATTLGFNIAVDSGTADITGGQIVSDGNGGAHLSMAVTFNGVEGRITNSTTTDIATADLADMSNLNLSNLNLRLRYMVDYINMKDFQFQFDIATVTIRRMVFSDNEHYSPKDNDWAFGAAGSTLLDQVSVLRQDAVIAHYGGRTCASDGKCGSLVPSTTGSIQVQQSENWTNIDPLSAERSNHTATLLPSGKLLVAGGVNDSGVLGSSELYDPETKKWAKSGPMDLPRNLHSATLLLEGTVLVAGGFRTGTSTGAASACEIFYPDSGAWVPTGAMNDARSYHGAVLLPDGNVLVAGGYDAGGNYLNTAEVYISTGRVWRRVGNLLDARAQHTLTLLHTGEVLAAGGLNPSILNRTETYNPQTGNWTGRANLNTQRHSHTAALLKDGRVMVAGGDDGFGEIAAAEVYNPGSNQWTYTVDLPLTVPSLLEIVFPRLKHNMQLLPNGKVVLVGGVQALGSPVLVSDGYYVEYSSWGVQGSLNTARVHHTTTLLKDGNMLTVGGFDGLDYLNSAESQYFSFSPDLKSPPPSLRKPALQEVVPSSFTRGSAITVKGSNFTGLSEASSGRGSIQSASLPRITLQRLDSGGSNTQAGSGFEVDITTFLHAGSNLWQNIGTSITFTVPSSTGLLPNGWYHLRVGANAQYSDSLVVQVAPPKPLYATGTPYPRDFPSGTLPPNVSSVTWTWAAAPGTFDGYHIYSATSGVFLGTSAVNSFLQTGLGPDTQASIKVAPFSIAGDGPVSLSTTSLVTQSSEISGLRGTAKSPSSIEWSWNSNQTALAYQVYTTTGIYPVAQTNTNSFQLTGLSTNTVHGAYVQVVSAGGSGLLSSAATAYTMAVVPLAAVPPLDKPSSGSFLASWTENTNPSGTRYVFEAATSPAGAPIIVSTVTALQFGVTSSSVTPDIRYYARVAALNGDGVTTSFASLESTATLSREPASLAVSFAGPSSIKLSWNANGNSSLTTYQILYSTDDFAAHVVTHTAFSAGFADLSKTVDGLVTSTTYFFRVSARNQFGRETSNASIQSYTSGGGGPPGTITSAVPRDQLTVISGNVGGSSIRSVDIRVPARTFPSDVTLYISTQSLSNLQVGNSTACGSIDAAINITPSPAIQPDKPFQIGLSYNSGDFSGSTRTLSMGRYDRATNTCVPLPSTVDSANRMVYAVTNHLSDFQLMQVAPKSTIDGMRVFPNPLYARNQGYFTFDRLPADTRVRVYTLHGEELLDSRTNPSGVATWDARNKAGRSVASGVYLAVIEGSGGKKILKLAVIR